ncbi:MAG: DUF1064 domain-containing protein [Candidatus Cloacimonetes bacterium]|nr:DUF1064 domain-containing protein [Candidatus Cloacimonadota bacterium]
MTRWTEEQYKAFQQNKLQNQLINHNKKEGRFKGQSAGMNKTEIRMKKMLDSLKITGSIKEFSYEDITFKLAEKMRYTPDFRVIYPDGKIKFIEVKGGYITERGDLKFKFAMDKYPEYIWEMWQWKDNRWKVINGNSDEVS